VWRRRLSTQESLWFYELKAGLLCRLLVYKPYLKFCDIQKLVRFHNLQIPYLRMPFYKCWCWFRPLSALENRGWGWRWYSATAGAGLGFGVGSGQVGLGVGLEFTHHCRVELQFNHWKRQLNTYPFDNLPYTYQNTNIKRYLKSINTYSDICKHLENIWHGNGNIAFGQCVFRTN
jgi:hypothetical protein